MDNHTCKIFGFYYTFDPRFRVFDLGHKQISEKSNFIPAPGAKRSAHRLQDPLKPKFLFHGLCRPFRAFSCGNSLSPGGARGCIISPYQGEGFPVFTRANIDEWQPDKSSVAWTTLFPGHTSPQPPSGFPVTLVRSTLSSFLHFGDESLNGGAFLI